MRILGDIRENYGISGDIMISWDIRVYFGISGDILDIRIQGNGRGYEGMSWDMRGYQGI